MYEFWLFLRLATLEIDRLNRRIEVLVGQNLFSSSSGHLGTHLALLLEKVLSGFHAPPSDWCSWRINHAERPPRRRSRRAIRISCVVAVSSFASNAARSLVVLWRAVPWRIPIYGIYRIAAPTAISGVPAVLKLKLSTHARRNVDGDANADAWRDINGLPGPAFLDHVLAISSAAARHTLWPASTSATTDVSVSNASSDS